MEPDNLTNEVEQPKDQPELAPSEAETELPDATPEEGVEGDGEEVSRDGDMVIDEKKEFYDKDEEIITNQFFSKGITQVTSKQLIDAGIDQDRIHPTTFKLGIYELSRVLMISKYTITKLV